MYIKPGKKIVLILHDIWKKTWIFWCTLVLFIFIYFENYDNIIISPIRSYISNYVIIVNGKVTEHISNALSIVNNVKEFIALREINEKLKMKNMELEQYYFASKTIEKENEHLQKLLNVIEQRELKFITAKIYYYVNNPYTKNIVIAAGANHGVKKNQIVINDNGVVGRIIEVGDDYSRILLINDSNSHIPVLTEQSGERGIAVGFDDGSIKIKYLPDDNMIESGELVFTSGEIESFPSGILVGVVMNKTPDEVTVAPAVDFNHLDYVIVLTE